jgi:hypothetical protein
MHSTTSGGVVSKWLAILPVVDDLAQGRGESNTGRDVYADDVEPLLVGVMRLSTTVSWR